MPFRRPLLLTGDLAALQTAAIEPEEQFQVERARELARGFRVFVEQERIDPALAEGAYLLGEARRPLRPLVERLRILGLMATAIDQLFAEGGTIAEGSAVLSSTELRQLAPILDEAADLLSEELLPQLADRHQVAIRPPATLSESARGWLRTYFRRQVFPLLTPLAIDPGHPFPFISTFSLNFLVRLRGVDSGWQKGIFARIKVPRFLPRYIEPLRQEESHLPIRSHRSYVLSEEMVRFFLPDLFPGLQVEHAYLFRVIRRHHEMIGGDRLSARSETLRYEQLSSPVVRLDVEETMPHELVEWLLRHLEIEAESCFRIRGPMALFQLIDLANLIEMETYPD